MTTYSEKDKLVSLYKRVYLVRTTEEKLGHAKPSDGLYGPVHLMIGQELIMSTLSAFLSYETYGDVIYGSHRSHACFLTLSQNPYKLFAEIMGKETGCSQGMGGSMQLSCLEKGFLGSSSIISSIVPMAVGSALKLKSSQGVAIGFFGDGACEEGIVSESFNLAATWQVPAMFLCINNQMASHLKIHERQTNANMTRFAIPHEVKSFMAIGSDPFDLMSTFDLAIKYMRETRLPTFVEVRALKMSEHVGQSINENYGHYHRGKFKAAFNIDPCEILEQSLERQFGASKKEIDDIKKDIENVVNDAWDKAKKDPSPDVSHMYKFLGAADQ